jgi:hypothetical protein
VFFKRINVGELCLDSWLSSEYDILQNRDQRLGFSMICKHVSIAVGISLEASRGSERRHHPARQAMVASEVNHHSLNLRICAVNCLQKKVTLALMMD